MVNIFMKILLVEDDKILGEGIKRALSHFSYIVDWVTDGAKALAAALQESYGLMILDLGLPDCDGITVLQDFRRKNIDTPVLILTARGDVSDKILGLDSGGDDYMVKPFDIEELEARIRTLTRRTNGRRSDTIRIGRSELDLSQRVLRYEQKEIDFSRREFSLIQAFFEYPKKIYTREYLESISYGRDDEIESNALEVHIHRLRKKIGAGAIKTVRGVGYMLVADFFS